MGSVIFKRPPVKKLRKEGLFGVDMHFHTKYSLDAVSRIPAAIKKAEKKGFGFAITDHNTVEGVMQSYRLRKDVLIIPGIEVTCRNGNHILAYFHNHKELEEFFEKRLKPRMKRNPFFVDISAQELVDLSKNYNANICAAHPFAPGALGIMHTGVTKRLEKGFDFIEVLNGYNFRRSNLNAIYWASKIDKSTTGGSDGHSTFELGKVLTFTHGNDIESILKEMLKNRSIIVGKEDNIFLKTVMGIRKESAYVNRTKKQKMAKTLLKSQFGNEYKYLKERFTNGRIYQAYVKHRAEASEKEKSTDF